ncbi:MAG: DUF1553 domain-containing protein [Verrucomicrobiales bacterium]
MNKQIPISSQVARIVFAALLISEAAPRANAGRFDFEGSKDRLPWIWEKPQRGAIPSVEEVAWPVDSVDRFVLRKLEVEKLQPAEPASDRVWMRRAHFAITGLPPKPEEVQAFLNDPSKDRKRTLVRSLLDSPHYGERWARHWMDLVRYAESRGHEGDAILPNAYHYRDYLVRAFNTDLPYDAFVTEHLAGDLLETPRRNPETGANESILATAWPFFGEESGTPVDLRQDECDRLDNKVDVLSKTFLGLTVACARCHDHKFDAIRQSDYYAMAGFVLSSSYRQARFESMEQNKVVAETLERLRRKHLPKIAKAFAEAARPVVDALDENATVELTTSSVYPVEGEHQLVADYTQGPTPWLVDGPTFGPSSIRPGQLILVTEQTSVPLPRWTRLIVAVDPGSQGEAWAKPAFDHGMWKTMKLPGHFENAGLPSHDGVVWFRKTIELSAGQAASRAILHLGQIDDMDVTWVNGTRVGGYENPGHHFTVRKYPVPAGLLRAGKNTIAVRVMDHGFSGGIAGKPEQLSLQLGEETVSLANLWHFAPGANLKALNTDAALAVPKPPLDQPLALSRNGGTIRDAFWNGLKNVNSENDPGALDGLARAGKTIRTPTVTLASGQVHYLIRGKAKVYAAISQALFTGPLHKTLMRTVEANGDAPRWIAHDLRHYAGQRVHFEFSPIGDAPLEILQVIDGGTPGHLPGEKKQVPREELHRALDDLMDGVLEARHMPHVAWLFEQGTVHLSAVQLQAWQSVLESLRKDVRWDSRLAVSWWGGTGVDEHVLARGRPESPGERVGRNLPELLAMAPLEGGSPGRLELAQQLTAREHPLTSRVMVNRIWHQLFGRGIVFTPDNFGWLGERPSHPELLDYLAVEFADTHAYSIKSIIERLVLSRTFGMSSKAANSAYAEQDPENRWLHRMPVRRLEAEVIRDSALAISGRLDRSVGGKPVLVHLTEFVVGRGTPTKSGPLDGDGRRSVYTALRRNFIPTFMLAFDFPRPFSTVGKRNVTNVAAQSLVLMNDPFLYQQSGIWAKRIIEKQPSAPKRIQQMYAEAFNRPPSDHELAACLEALTAFAGLYGGDPNGHEAWRDLCHSFYSMTDFIYLK